MGGYASSNESTDSIRCLPKQSLHPRTRTSEYSPSSSVRLGVQKTKRNTTSTDKDHKVQTTLAYQTPQAVLNRTSLSRLSLQTSTPFFPTHISPTDPISVYSSSRLRLSTNACSALRIAPTSRASMACDVLRRRRGGMRRLSDGLRERREWKSATYGVL